MGGGEAGVETPIYIHTAAVVPVVYYVPKEYTVFVFNCTTTTAEKAEITPPESTKVAMTFDCTPVNTRKTLPTCFRSMELDPLFTLLSLPYRCCRDLSSRCIINQTMLFPLPRQTHKALRKCSKVTERKSLSDLTHGQPHQLIQFLASSQAS